MSRWKRFYLIHHNHNESHVTPVQNEGNQPSSATVVLEQSLVPPTEKVTGDPKISGSYFNLVNMSRHTCSGYSYIL